MVGKVWEADCAILTSRQAGGQVTAGGAGQGKVAWKASTACPSPWAAAYSGVCCPSASLCRDASVTQASAASATALCLVCLVMHFGPPPRV